jgi:hypothetical protein
MARISDFSDLYQYAHASLPGCPSALFDQHILQAGRMFCQDSRVWREDLDTYDLVTGQKKYTLSPIADSVTYVARMEAVLQVRQNTDDGVTNGDRGTLINWRQYSFSVDTNILEFVTAPSSDVTDGLEVKVILVPQLAALDLNDWVLNVYAETILARAMHTLKSIKKTEWSDTQEAADKFLEYRSGVGKAKGDIARRGGEGSTGVTS